MVLIWLLVRHIGLSQLTFRDHQYLNEAGTFEGAAMNSRATECVLSKCVYK
jgi:hypothetical protein